MPKVIEGHLQAGELRFAIVASRFNSFVVEPLVAGALDAITRTGGNPDEVTLVRCPGAWELPQVVAAVARAGQVDAIIALGAVIRGSTPHFDFVAGEAAAGVARAAGEVAISFGVLTTDTIEQAIERAGTKAGNKGWEAALTVIEMCSLQKALGAHGSEKNS